MKTRDELKAEIAKRMSLICYIGVTSASVDYVADSILSIVIQEGVPCRKCNGFGRLNFYIAEDNIEEVDCKVCKGTGKLPDKTLGDLVKG